MQVLHGVQMNTHALNSANLQFYCNSIYLNKNNIHDSNWITRFFKICTEQKGERKKNCLFVNAYDESKLLIAGIRLLKMISFQMGFKTFTTFEKWL